MIKKLGPVKPEIDIMYWHNWFAWYPVIIIHNGQRYRVWREIVMRKLECVTYEVWEYKYKFIDNNLPG